MGVARRERTGLLLFAGWPPLVTRFTGFDEVYIPSAAHDAGISMGAALYVYNPILKQPRPTPVWSAYTGSRFTNEEIEAYLGQRNVAYSRHDDDVLFEMVADQPVEDYPMRSWNRWTMKGRPKPPLQVRLAIDADCSGAGDLLQA